MRSCRGEVHVRVFLPAPECYLFEFALMVTVFRRRLASNMYRIYIYIETHGIMLLTIGRRPVRVLYNVPARSDGRSDDTRFAFGRTVFALQKVSCVDATMRYYSSICKYMYKCVRTNNGR